jgi:polygalacturonase
MHSCRMPATLLAGAAAFLFSSTLFAQTLATGDSRNITRPPEYPAVCQVLYAQFSSSQVLSPPSSSSDDTQRLAQALTNCAGTGESVVLKPTSTSDAFFAGALTVNGEGLVVGAGVTLYGSNYGGSQFISVKGNDASIMGPGTIDGRANSGESGTPRLINAKHITNFNVYNVTLKNACKMHLYMEDGDDVTVWGLTVLTPANTKNTDGVDIDSLSDVTVTRSFINDGDDGIVVKTNSAPASDITVKGNMLFGTHGLSIGSQTMYGVTNVLWENNIVFGTDLYGIVSSDNNGIRIKSDPTCGGPVTQVSYFNTLFIGVEHLLDFDTDYGTCSNNGQTPQIPQYTDILVDNLLSAGSPSGAYSQFEGHDASTLLQIYLAHIHLDSTTQYDKVTGLNESQYSNVYLDDSNIVPSGPGVTTYNFRMPPLF